MTVNRMEKYKERNKMTFYPERNLVLVNCRTAEKDGKKYTFATLADPETYENQTFMLGREQTLEFLIPKNRYRLVLEIEGKYSTATLIPVETKKPA
jgi:hypothetical protein